MTATCVITVYVRDLERARAFYYDQFGFETMGEPRDGIVQLKVNSITVILEEIQGDCPKKPCVAIGVRARDLVQDVAYLREQGVTFFQEEPQPFPAGLFAAC